MKRVTFYCLAGGIFMIFASCKKKLPTACFKADKTVIETGESVTFTSCSSNASRLEWDFGDGATASGESVSHKFQKAGVYSVQARAYAKKDRASDRFSVVITVKDPPVPPPPATRYLTRIEVTAFPQTKPDNSNWDGFPSTGNAVNPDLFVKFELINGGWFIQTPEVANAVQAVLPLKWDLGPANVKFTNQNWRVSLLDNDAIAGAGGADTLYTTTVNLHTASASSGKISLGNTQVKLDIYFEEK